MKVGTEKSNTASEGQKYVHLLSYLGYHPRISQQPQNSQNKVSENILKLAS
jgi:hypothetical protein